MNTTEPNLDELLDGIIASIAGDVFDYACDADSDRDEAVYSATQSHKKALERVISDQIAKALEDVYDEQKTWMHEHTELKLGYATYMLTIVKDRAKKERSKE
jgi:hypothetical protein